MAVVDDPADMGKIKVGNVPDVPETVPVAATLVGEMLVGNPKVAFPF